MHIKSSKNPENKTPCRLNPKAKAFYFFANLKSIIKQLESELESYGIKFTIDRAHKYTHIEYMCTNTITYFQIRIEVRHKENTAIKSFLLNHSQPTIKGTKEYERRLVSCIGPPI